jgi:amidase
MTDLWRLTATEAVTRLRKPELSPLELAEAAASRMEAVEPKINALADPLLQVDESIALAEEEERCFVLESARNVEQSRFPR